MLRPGNKEKINQKRKKSTQTLFYAISSVTYPLNLSLIMEIIQINNHHVNKCSFLYFLNDQKFSVLLHLLYTILPSETNSYIIKGLKRNSMWLTCVERVATCWVSISFSSLANRLIWLALILSDISLKLASS